MKEEIHLLTTFKLLKHFSFNNRTTVAFNVNISFCDQTHIYIYIIDISKTTHSGSRKYLFNIKYFVDVKSLLEKILISDGSDCTSNELKTNIQHHLMKEQKQNKTDEGKIYIQNSFESTNAMFRK